MDELGYVPNHAGRSLRIGSSQALGLLVPDVSNPFYAELARGVEDVAQSLGFNVLLCNTNFERTREERYAHVFRSGVVDGLIYAAAASGGYGSERLARDLPVVVVNETPGDIKLDTVNTDNERGGELAGEHLRGLGHTSVLVIDGPPGSPTSDSRRSGFERAFAGTDVTLGHRCGDYRGPSAARIIGRELEERGAWFTAVYAANDVMAVAAIGALQTGGLTVPDEVSVVGYDDSVLAALVTPALTTIRQPIYDMAAQALTLLGRTAESDKIVDDFLRAHPTSPQANNMLLSRAQNEANTGNTTAALADYQKVKDNDSAGRDLRSSAEGGGPPKAQAE